jgi:hypothetical protein
MDFIRASAHRREHSPLAQPASRLALLALLAAPSCAEVDRSVAIRPGPLALNVAGAEAELTTRAVGAPATYTDGSSASASSARIGAAALAPLLSISVVAPAADPRSIVRIYKDHDAWRSISDGGRDEASLVSLGKVKGVDFYVHPMASLASGIPAGTRAVVITANSAGSAATSIAQRSDESQQKLVEFLRTGGTVLIDLADNEAAEGYRAPGASGTPLYEVPPRPVCDDATLAAAALGADGIAGTADDHRVVRGPDGIAGNADDLDDVKIDLSNGGSDQQDPDMTEPSSPIGCSIAHGDLEDHGDLGGIKLPGNARVLATATWGSEQRAVLAEYCHAGGRVVVNTLTLGYFDHKPREGTMVPLRMSHIQKSLFAYALSAETYCNAAPTIMAPANLDVVTDAGACSATILDVGEADVVDDAAGVSLGSSRSDGQPLSAPYPKGVTSITWTATDAAGESATATQTVTVSDEEDPVLVAPADMTVVLGPGASTASVNVGSASATDNCPGVSTTATRSDGLAVDAPYGVGATTIIWRAIDGSGREVSGVQTIVVKDEEAPVVTVPANFAVSATTPGGAIVTYAMSATDNVGVASQSCTLASGSAFPIGRNVVTCTATDASGNSTSQSFTVMVLGAPEQILKLIEYIKGQPIGATHRTQLLDLLTKVLSDPRSTPYACRALDFFIAAVKAKRGTAIPTAKADYILSEARRIRNVLGCPM